MKSGYGDPFCQSLKALPLDDLIACLVLEAVMPAAIEASAALVENLEAERAALDRHWRQKLERAGYEVERARRQYAAVEPENRLVARTLERAWEAALTEQARLEAEYERLKRDKPQALSAAELAAIRELTHDLPALWRAETTTRAERHAGELRFACLAHLNGIPGTCPAAPGRREISFCCLGLRYARSIGELDLDKHS